MTAVSDSEIEKGVPSPHASEVILISPELVEPAKGCGLNPVSETSSTVTTTGSVMSQLESQLDDELSKQRN